MSNEAADVSTTGIPARCGYFPVSSEARDGEHTGELLYQSVKRMPDAAKRSRFGVFTPDAP